MKLRRDPVCLSGGIWAQTIQQDSASQNKLPKTNHLTYWVALGICGFGSRIPTDTKIHRCSSLRWNGTSVYNLARSPGVWLVCCCLRVVCSQLAVSLLGSQCWLWTRVSPGNWGAHYHSRLPPCALTISPYNACLLQRGHYRNSSHAVLLRKE